MGPFLQTGFRGKMKRRKKWGEEREEPWQKKRGGELEGKTYETGVFCRQTGELERTELTRIEGGS